MSPLVASRSAGRSAVVARCAAVAVALALAAGCSASAPTRIVVIVESDLAVPERLDAVRFTIDATAIGGAVQAREVSSLRPESLPLVLPVVHEAGGEGPITVRVAGLHAGAEIVERSARLSFVPGRAIALRVRLEAACAWRERPCDGAKTCVRGACVEPDVDPSSLPEWGGDAGVGDGDGGPPSCPVRAVCEEGCACSAGCSCELRCAERGECRAIECTGEGTACRVDADKAARLGVRCEAGARCTIDARDVARADELTCASGADCAVDCDGASDCRLSCERGATCLLDCHDAERCELACEGARQTCDRDVVVCDRSCP